MSAAWTTTDFPPPADPGVPGPDDGPAFDDPALDDDCDRWQDRARALDAAMSVTVSERAPGRSTS